MLGNLQFIRKRTAQRRFVALWVCLVALELFCPAIYDGRTYASAKVGAGYSKSVQSDGPGSASMSDCNDATEHHGSKVCDDECLCHISALPVTPFVINTARFSRDRVVPRFVEGIFDSLPPPYLPPKFS